ncbi:MAG: hypothetical protein AB7O28_25405 [Vicinamibacterales bacterium]
MPSFRFRFVLPAGHRAVATVTCLVAMGVAPAHAAAQPSLFAGPYVSVEAGRQHVIGGSLVDGVDTLQEDSRGVVSLSGGLRGALGPLVVGGDVGLGRLDGALELRDDATGTTVRYDTSSQWHWRLTGGVTLGPRTLAYAYVSEVTRTFDVAIVRAGATTPQQDEQGLLRFGLGAERQLRGAMHAFVAAGSSRADFAGRQTNIAPGRRFEASVGLTLQF